mmetsp:Transcript_10330/g.31779  ORF Transcript_10330/g.31779 Transcript_10330/m.31779 type:complete len:85 (+) Transcript_10330:694-948(+)
MWPLERAAAGPDGRRLGRARSREVAIALSQGCRCTRDQCRAFETSGRGWRRCLLVEREPQSPQAEKVIAVTRPRRRCGAWNLSR